MKIPEDTNTRAEAMWRIIGQRIDFRGKRVIDLGCGHGEMLWRAKEEGAEEVYGIDSTVVNWELHEKNDIYLAEADINHMVDGKWFPTPYQDCDIALCFSVLPYLDNVPATLKWMSDNFPLCIIEVQYEPEPYNIGVPSDDKMYVLLRENGFKCATWLGETYIEDRDTHRSIWACSKKMLRL